MLQRCDALILGGGPAGATAAILLARAGWSVVVLERQRFPRRKVCGEYLSGTNWPLLKSLGVLDIVDASAGPEVTSVGLFAKANELIARLPKPERGWGRALSRERLDMLLLEKAKTAGATVVQPCVAESLRRTNDCWICCTRFGDEFQSSIVIAAHGSWDHGNLPTQKSREAPKASDLFGFKSHFRNAKLQDGLMPLIAFPGGYGGMVHAGDGLVSISCCVRRDRLVQLRGEFDSSAGVVVEEYLRESSSAVDRVLRNATRVGSWLAAGPIRPGMRLRWPPGIFAVGNAAGEAHPVIAEGISMAMQSAWLLADRLTHAGRRISDLDPLAAAYAADWRRSFRRRIRASRVVANWAMSPTAVAMLHPLISQFPRILTWGALASGKALQVVHTSQFASVMR